MIIDDINAKVSMLDILKMYNIEPIRLNSYKCPFHQDKHPSAGITKNGKFHCFSCGWTGDQIDFVMGYEKCDKKTAIKIIDKNFGLGLCKALTPLEKKELEKAMFLREVDKFHKDLETAFEQEVRKQIIDKMRFWEYIRNECEPKFTQIVRNKWFASKVYFYAIKELARLDTIYCKVCGIECEPNELDYYCSNGEKDVLKQIRKGIIVI